MKKKTMRQQQAEETRERILKAVGEMLTQKSIQEMKIREICTLAGISVGTFYLYFPCKEAALLYGYRTLDHIFSSLTFTDNHRENVETVLRTHIGLVTEEDLPRVKQMYICHLTYYDEYFFSEERPLFTALYEQLAAYAPHLGEEETKELAWKLLSLSRGFMYNLCIRQEVEVSLWRERKLRELMEYMDFLLEK